MNLLLDASTLVKYENIALWVLFGLVIFVLLYSLFRGAFRGWAYGTYRLIFFIIAITAIFLTLDLTVNAIGSLDLSKWITKSISVTIDGKTISAQVTSVSGTLEALITDAVKQFDMNVDPTNLSTFAMGLANSLLKLVVILLFGILLCTLGKFLCWLLWHIAFKFIIPKSQRKLTKEEKKANEALPRSQRRKTIYKKVRGVSMGEELVINLLLLCMVAVPITGTINSMVNSFASKEEDETSQSSKLKANDETLNTVQTAIDTYQNSVFSKAFFSWTVNNEGKSWDSQLLSMLTQANITETVTASAIDIVSEAAGLAKDVINSGILSSEGTTFDKIYLLLTTEYGINIISTIANSSFVTTLLPMAVEFALNLDAIKTYVGNSLGIDYYGYNWSATVSELSGVISDLQSSDIFDFFTDVDGAAHFDTDSIASLFSDDSKEAMSNLFDRFSKRPDEKNLFNDLITVFLVNYALNGSSSSDTSTETTTGDGSEETSSSSSLSLNDFLPSTEGCEYETDANTGRKYVSKLNDAYTNLSLGDELNVVYSSLCDINDLDDRLTALIVDSLVDSEKELDTDVLLDIIVSNIDEITKIIAGSEEDDSKTCLMDCSFLTYGMGAITEFIGDTLSSALDTTIDLSSVKDELFSDSLSYDVRNENAKVEMRGILGVVKNFVNADPICEEFIKDLDAMPGIVYEPNGNLHSISDGLLDGFIALAESIDDSKILTSALPSIANKFLTGNDALKELGIDSINVNVDNFGSELASLLKVAKDCMPLIQFVMNEANNLSGASSREISNVISGLAEYHDQLITLLNGVVGNKILNDEKNTTYRNLLGNLLSQLLNKEITLPESINPEVENEVVADLIYGLGTYTTTEMLSALLGGGSVSLSALSGVDFGKILKPLDSSEVFGDIIADMLDTAVVPMLGNTATELNLSFKNVASWEQEGEALNAIVKFGSEIGDLSNIDFFGSDPEVISSLLKALSGSQMFGTDDNYTFGKFFYKTMVNSLGDAISFFEDKNAAGTTAEERTAWLGNAMNKLSKSAWEREADVFGDIIGNLSKALKGESLSGSLSVSSIKASAVQNLLYSLAESKTIGRPVTYHLYEQIGKSLKDAGLEIGTGDYGYMNIDWIWDAYDNVGVGTIQNEMYHLSYFLETVMDPGYGLLDADGNLSSASIDISTVSGKYFMTPLTKSLATSIVFNTVPDDSTHETAFECLMTQTILSSGMYGAFDSVSKEDLLSYVQNVSPDTQKVSVATSSDCNRLADDGPWAKECEAFGNLTDCIINLSVGVTSGFNPSDIFSSKNELENEAKRLALKDVISAVNESSVLYHFLPNILKSGIENVASSLGADGATPNYYYMGEGLKADRYGDDEIENITNIIYYAATADLSVEISQLDADSATNILACLAKSHIFNSSPDNSTTFFQSVMSNIFGKDEIGSRYYYASNPKDNPTYNSEASNYSDAKSKAIYMVSKLFPEMSATSSCSDQINIEEVLTGDNYTLKSFINMIKENSEDYKKITGDGFMELDASFIEKVGKELSNNALLADIFVNTLASTFETGFSSSSIIMKNANPYYCYWMGEDGTMKALDSTSEADFSKGISDGEIETLSEFIPLFNSNSSLFDNLASATIDTSTITTFKNILTLLNSSYIFHEGGAWLPNKAETISSWQEDLTVFEQTYGLMLKSSTLSNMSYKDTYDGKNYESADMKLNSYIKAFNAGTLDSLNSGNWGVAISALTTDENGGGVLSTLLNLGIIGDGMSAEGLDLMSFEPNKLSLLLKALNNVDIVKDLIPYQMRNLLSGDTDFSTYSTISFDIDSYAGSYDSLTKLGRVGTFSSITLSGMGSASIFYTYDGTHYIESETKELTANPSFDLNGAIGFNIISGSVSSITNVTLDTSNVFLTQEEYGKDGGAIDSLIALFNKLYAAGGGSYPKIDSASSETVETLLSVFSDVMKFIDDDNGFYTRAYDSSMRSVSENESFLARDVFMRNVLKVTYDNDGTSYSLDIGQRFDNPLNDIHNIFEASDYNVDTESSWFTNYLMDAEKIEFGVSGAVGEIEVESRILPSYHSSLETISYFRTDDSSDYTFTYLLKNVGSSKFGTSILNNMAKAFIKSNETYACGGSYFKEAATNDPNDDDVRKAGSLEAKETYPTYLDSFDAINNDTHLGIVGTMLNVVKVYGFKALADGTSDVEEFKLAMNAFSAMEDKTIVNFFYNSAIYDYMLNRNNYHAEVDYPVHLDRVSYPNAFATGFSYLDVATAAN